ncbi:hypothetical protein JCM3765_003414 [Sporobolomyces pararoseus]
MNREQFRQAGYAAIDRVCDYYETLDQRDVVPRVKPGEIASLIDREAPTEGEKWEKIAGDFDRVIMPGIRDRNLLTSALDVTPHYLRTAQAQANLVVDYRNWSLFLGRRFHSLKIWYTLRSFGVKGFQAHLRKGIKLGKVVEELIKEEEEVELFTPRSFSLVVFRLVDPSRDAQVENKLNSALTKRLNSRHDIFLTETSVGGKICLRFCPGSRETEERHVRDSWERVIRPCIEEARKDVKECE